MKLFIILIALFLVGCSGTWSREQELNYTIKLYQCVYYCSAIFVLEDCKRICTSSK